MQKSWLRIRVRCYIKINEIIIRFRVIVLHVLQTPSIYINKQAKTGILILLISVKYMYIKVGNT